MLVEDNIHWHKEADVVVVGLGLAGAACAITAHDEGAEVIVLEKQPAYNHVSNSTMASGTFLCPTDIPEAIAYMEALCRVNEGLSWTNRDVLRSWVEYSAQNKMWIEGLGGTVVAVGRLGEHIDLPGYKSIQAYVCKGMGWGLMELVTRQIRSRDIPISYDTRASKVLIDFRGRVSGVRALVDGEELNVKAYRAVVLTTGGFEYDEEMKLNYLKTYPTYFTGSPANTGDGIRMAQDVGASLWHMNCVSGGAVAKVPDIPASFRIDLAARSRRVILIPQPDGIPLHERVAESDDECGYIVVDKHGRRFCNEALMFLKSHGFYYEFTAYDTERREFPRLPSYGIIDRRRINLGPLPGLYTIQMRRFWGYGWSSDNQTEIKKGWITQGDSIGDLAGQLGIDPDTLERTVQTYNRHCQRKEDAEFHRPPHHLTPLDEPPFFAVKLWGGGPNTQGGPRRNHLAQILNTDGEPIPGLYGAGECGCTFGLFYPAAGGNLAECIAFGRIAGENAARETRVL